MRGEHTCNTSADAHAKRAAATVADAAVATPAVATAQQPRPRLQPYQTSLVQTCSVVRTHLFAPCSAGLAHANAARSNLFGHSNSFARNQFGRARPFMLHVQTCSVIRTCSFASCLAEYAKTSSPSSAFGHSNSCVLIHYSFVIYHYFVCSLVCSFITHAMSIPVCDRTR